MRRKIKDNQHLFWEGSVLNNVQGITPQQYISRPNIQSGIASPQGQQLQNLNNIGKDYSYPSTSNFNMGYVTGAIDSISSITNTLNSPTQNIYDAVYSDGSQDPIGRFINDVTGRNTQTAINQVNQSRIKNTNAKTLDDVAQMYANYSTMPLLRRSKNNAFNAIGLTAIGAPWLSYNQSGKLSFDAGNLQSFAQGASKGAQFGGPWGALWGGVAGGLFNVFSRIGQNRRIRKINKAIKNVNAYNQRALENQKTNVLQDNMSNMLRNYAAYGGPILGALDYEMANKQLNNYENRTSANASNIIPYFQALNTFGDGGSIHIKPSKRGTFTAAAKKRNMGVQEFASKVLANKEDYSPAMVKKANFARNASKWKHDFGGPITDEQYIDIMEKVAEDNYKRWGFNNSDEALIHALNDNTYNYREYYNKYPNSNANALTHWTDEFKTVYHPTFSNESIYSGKKSQYNPQGLVGGHWDKETFIPASWQKNKKKAFGGSLQTHGGDWSNGLTWFNNGGSHEENPYDGIPQGIAPDGKPNLVEEGEVKYNDYIFSDRLTVPEDIQNKYKVKDNTTFAKAVKKLSKESEERPNDPISQNGLDIILNDLTNSQEEIRMKKQQKENRKYARGGLLDSENLRYAPVVGSAIGALSTAFSKPDYESADMIANAANSAGQYMPVSFNPIGDYLGYSPLDINYMANQLRASEQAAARNIMNTSGGNRGTAMAGLLANTYNSQLALGDAYRKAQEANLAQQQQVAEFNRKTNLINSQGILDAARANQEAKMKAGAQYLEGINRAATLRQQIKNNRQASLSANLTGLFDNLGAVGEDIANRRDRDFLMKNGVFGTMSLEGMRAANWSDKEIRAEYEKRGYSKSAIDGIMKTKSYGGKIRKKKGLTF